MLLTVVLTVRTGVLQPVFSGTKNILTVTHCHLEAVLWKVFPGRLSFPDEHPEHTASS